MQTGAKYPILWAKLAWSWIKITVSGCNEQADMLTTSSRFSPGSGCWCRRAGTGAAGRATATRTGGTSSSGSACTRGGWRHVTRVTTVWHYDACHDSVSLCPVLQRDCAVFRPLGLLGRAGVRQLVVRRPCLPPPLQHAALLQVAAAWDIYTYLHISTIST